MKLLLSFAGPLFWADVCQVELSEGVQRRPIYFCISLHLGLFGVTRHIHLRQSARRDSEATSAFGGTCSAEGSQAQLGGPFSFHDLLKRFETVGRKVLKRNVRNCWQEGVWTFGRSSF